MNTDTMNTPPPPPDDSYVVMLGRDVPKPFPYGTYVYDNLVGWSVSSFNKGMPWDGKHPNNDAPWNKQWYAVPKSAMPEEKPAKHELGADGWIPHKPGDPCPCGPDDVVEVKFPTGNASNSKCANEWIWSKVDGKFGPVKGREIIAWRPHKPASSTISRQLIQQLDDKDAIIDELNERLQELTEALLLQQELFTKEIRELRKQLKQVARATKPV